MMIYKFFEKLEQIGMKFLAIVFILGCLLWASVLGFPDAFLMSYGCILAMITLSLMVCYSYYYKSGRPILSLVSGILMFFMIFFGFCWMGIVPMIESRPIFGILSLPLFISFGGTTTTTVVSVKTHGKYGPPTERTYEVKSKTRADGVKEIISIKRLWNKDSKK